MREPKPTTHCRRCDLQYRHHGQQDHGFVQRVSARDRFGQTFSAQEVEWAHQLFVCLLGGGDARILMRHPAAGVMARKFAAMRQTSERRRREGCGGMVVDGEP